MLEWLVQWLGGCGKRKQKRLRLCHRLSQLAHTLANRRLSLYRISHWPKVISSLECWTKSDKVVCVVWQTTTPANRRFRWPCITGRLDPTMVLAVGEKHPEMKPKQWHNSIRKAPNSCRLFGRSINGPEQSASFAPHSHALLRAVCVCDRFTHQCNARGSLRREALFPRSTLARELFPPPPKRTRIGPYTLNEWAKSLKFDDFNAKQPQNHSNFSNRFYSAITPTSFFGCFSLARCGWLYLECFLFEMHGEQRVKWSDPWKNKKISGNEKKSRKTGRRTLSMAFFVAWF